MKNTNAKAIAQASKMSKTAASTIAPAAKTKIELFGEAFNKFVRTHFGCVEHEDGSNDYFLRNVDLGNGKAVDYRMHFEAHEAKAGVRASHKRELYRIDEGKERVVQFGRYKKKFLYPLMNMVIAGKPAKSMKIVVDKALTGKIASAIRADRSAFKFADGVLSGDVKGVGAIKMTETVRKLKTGKTQLERRLFIDDVLKLEGGQLLKLKNAFVKTGKNRRSMKEILAEGDAAVSDLI